MKLSLFAMSAVVLAALVPAAAQSPNGTAARSYTPVPFGVGERMSYEVSVRALGKIGNGRIEVEGIDTIRGQETYRLGLQIKGGVPFAHVNDIYTSWLDMDELISRRFIQDVDEVNYERKRTIDFFPSERQWRAVIERPSKDGRSRKEETGEMPTNIPLDDLSFVFYARTLPLEIGKTYTLPRYFKDEGNPVTIKVLRRQTISVKTGTYQTIVVQPIIRTKGLFSEGGQAEIYFTDDDKRIPVMINVGLDVPIINKMKLELQSYSPGTRVSPPFRARDAREAN